MKKYKLFRISGVWIFFSVLAIIFFQTSCQTGAENKEDDKPKLVLPDSLVRTLEIDSVSSARVINSITLTGKVAFNEEHVVKIFPMVSGNVQDIKVMLGDFVQSGQILAVVRSSEMAGYSNDLVTAETNLEVAKKNLDATNDMYKSGLASARDQLAAEASYNQAQATLEKTQRILQINGGTKNGEYLVKSPIQGFIVEKNVNNNMVIRSDYASNLFTISDLKNVWVLANVYESNIPLIKAGDSVEVKTLSYPDRVFRGKLDKIMNVLDPTNKVMKVRIVLSNPEYLLKPEMFANVTVNNTENKRMVCIPSKALIFDHSQHYVLVYKSASDISIRPVQVANTVGDKSYISEGLNIGEKVIASQAILIYQELNS